jgi:hypothetical protein
MVDASDNPEKPCLRELENAVVPPPYLADLKHKEETVDTESGRGSLGPVVFEGVNENAVLRKMDIRLIPMLSALYLLAFLDRGNIGNAKIEGLVEDLNMTGPQYNWTCMCTSDSIDLISG